jgi:hypothetical protein
VDGRAGEVSLPALSDGVSQGAPRVLLERPARLRGQGAGGVVAIWGLWKSLAE